MKDQEGEGERRWRLITNGNQRRQISIRKGVAPALTEVLSKSTRRKATMWYLYKLPISESNKPFIEGIKKTLEKDRITAQEARELEEALDKFQVQRQEERAETMQNIYS